MSLKNLYQFRGNADDLVGSNDGVLGGATLPTNVAGYFSGVSAYSFSGGNGNTAGDRQRIELDKADFAYTDSTPFSYEIWFKSSKLDANAHILFGNRNGSINGYSLLYILSTENIRFLLHDGTNAALVATPGSVCDGLWHHVVATYDGNDNLELFLDGLSVSTGTAATPLSGNLYQAASKATIGATWLSATSNYNNDLTGEIGLFANYDHVLSATEVRNLYNKSKKIFINN